MVMQGLMTDYLPEHQQNLRFRAIFDFKSVYIKLFQIHDITDYLIINQMGIFEKEFLTTFPKGSQCFIIFSFLYVMICNSSLHFKSLSVENLFGWFHSLK